MMQLIVGGCDAAAFRIALTLDELMLASLNLVGWLASVDANARTDYLWRLAATPGRPKVTGWTAVIRDAMPAEERLTAARDRFQRGLDKLADALGDRMS